MGGVIVLHARRAGQFEAGAEQTLLGRLPYAYRLELERRDAPARAASLQALGLLAAGIERLCARPLDWSQLSFPEGGKPRLHGGPQFSIAHSARRVAVALCATCEIGLDVEDLGAHGLAHGALEDWTAVEAALKAVGAGVRRAADVRLAADRATAVLDGVVLQTRRLDLAADCVATLATPAPVAPVLAEEIAGRRPLIGGDSGR